MLQPKYSDLWPEAGLDEAGRGCLAGPVMAAAVVLPPDYHHPVLTDSKLLSRPQREALREEICREALYWAVGEVAHGQIDEINILNASFLAMHRALEKLPVEPLFLIVDGNRFTPFRSVPHACIVKGDSKYFSIAAASILAKTFRDDHMALLAEQHPEYGWGQNAGYPTIAHRRAIAEHGPSPFHRLTFKLMSG
jgi:ribonuclease HII